MKASARDQLCVNTIRFLSVDMVEKANSGHPGLPMGAAPMAYVLWSRSLRHNPKNPRWWDRDRFVLSAGLFEEQTAKHRQSVLPTAVTARLAVEAASPLGWERWTGLGGAIIGIVALLGR